MDSLLSPRPRPRSSSSFVTSSRVVSSCRRLVSIMSCSRSLRCSFFLVGEELLSDSRRVVSFVFLGELLSDSRRSFFLDELPLLSLSVAVLVDSLPRRSCSLANLYDWRISAADIMVVVLCVMGERRDDFLAKISPKPCCSCRFLLMVVAETWVPRVETDP